MFELEVYFYLLGKVKKSSHPQKNSFLTLLVKFCFYNYFFTPFDNKTIEEILPMGKGRNFQVKHVYTMEGV